MNWNTWWLFLVTETTLSLTPGPAVLLVISQGLRVGGARSILSSLGILAANACYFAVSATSVGAMLAASRGLFSAVRWLGVAYLLWCGATAIFGRSGALTPTPEGARPAESGWRLFLKGFVLQAANPKAIVFFVALLPQFVDPAAPVPRQMAILGVTSVAAEFLVLLGYGMLAGRASRLARQPRYARLANVVSGLLLAAAGGGLALIRVY